MDMLLPWSTKLYSIIGLLPVPVILYQLYISPSVVKEVCSFGLRELGLKLILVMSQLGMKIIDDKQASSLVQNMLNFLKSKAVTNVLHL